MKYIILAFCLFFQLQSFGRPIRVVVADLLGSAKYVDEVVVTGYDGKGRIFFRSLRFKDTLHSSSCGRQVSNGWNFPYKKEENLWTENQPFIGDTVLVIIDGYNRVKSYGKRVGNDYRLWSPLITWSIALFEFESPIRPIEKSKLLDNSDSAKISACWDGCLVPVDKLDGLVKEYRARFSKKINAISLEPFRGSPAYSIFYNDTLVYFSDIIWTDEPPGKLYSLILTYNNGKAVEIVPEFDKDHPRPFSEKRVFEMDKFKEMKIKSIRWIH